MASGDGECVRRPREYRCRLPGLSTDAPARRPPGPCQNAGRDADLKATPRQDGVEEIRIPGERAYREGNRLAREGIEIDRRIRDALGRLGALADFLVVPCNAAHVGLDELRKAAGCPVLSMIDAVVEEVVRRRCRRVGLLGAQGVPPPYVEALTRLAVDVERVDAGRQATVDAGIQAVMEGREAKEHTEAARAAVNDVRARAVDAVVLGCTEIPLLLGDEREAPDLIDPAALLAEAAVRHSIGAR